MFGAGARFQAIDLRWGVSEQASVDQRAISICLAEIARCQRITPRPNFIMLLGDRYGWCPPPSAIPAAEFERICAGVPAGEDRKLLEEWYPRDENAVPPVHYLRAREGDLVDYEVWMPVERRLRSMIERAVAGTRLAGEPRYVASATEQEIVEGALSEKVPDAAEHVFCFMRSIDGLPATARSFVDLAPDGTPDLLARARLEGLKARLRSELPGHVFDYRAQWVDGRPSGEHLARLAGDVRKALLAVISEQVEQLDEEDPLEEEIERHQQFGRERASGFIGREWIRSQIAQYLEPESAAEAAWAAKTRGTRFRTNSR